MNYLAVPYISNISKNILEYVDEVGDDDWQMYYNFLALPLPTSLLEKDLFLRSLMRSTTLRAGILKMEPNTCYNWHVDTKRLVGINMLLSGFETSKCLFAPSAKPNDVVFPIEPLNYYPDTYYIFNTQVPHSVINYDGVRLLFSVEFLGESSAITFDALAAICPTEHAE